MMQTLENIVSTLMAPDKGILAADESESSMNKRLASIGVPETKEDARRFRELLFTTPFIEEYLSGVILFDATIRESTEGGMPFSRLLDSKGIISGIKVDKGLQPFPNHRDEEISHGLDGLHDRLDEYFDMGARFTKWRSVIRISDDLPSEASLRANAHVLAYYAAIVQEHHMVPMVEPEVLFEGTHTLERSGEVLERTLSILFETLTLYKVSLPGLILKTSMALPGSSSNISLNPIAIARETTRALTEAVPEEVGGVVFLSGGQTPFQATQNLHAIVTQKKMPWPLTFSYSRALEEPVLDAWRGRDENIESAQRAFQKRLSLNVAARKGAYTSDME